MKLKPWLMYALITTVFWGLWGALIELPEKTGFPATLGYSVWAFTMTIPSLIGLKIINWKLDKDKKAIVYGLLIGLSGAAGQLLLFLALRSGPAYLVFPFVSLSPLVTILLSILLLREKASAKAWTGIIIALVAIPLLSYQPAQNGGSSGYLWIIFALLVFLLWGVQAYFMKLANTHMKAESIFFYMMITGIALIPFAILLTDFSTDINWGFKGPYLAAMIQILNSIGALFLVYAFRYGKAIIVSPLINAGAPVITIVISLIIYGVLPHTAILTGMVLAIVAIFLLAD
jgi:uncharacterized membrane protein